MASKPEKPGAPKAQKYPRKAITCQSVASIDEQGRSYAKLVTSPELAAYRVIGATESKTAFGEHIDAQTLLEKLREQATAVKHGDLSQPEAMLLGQATALQTLFVQLIETGMRAALLPQQELAMRLALKAQSQCRATLETLATIKNPPVVYAKQVNQTTGPQQINNGMAAPARAREIETEQSKLSGGSHELSPDTRASGLACRVDSALEAVGKIDRAEVGGR